MTAAHQNYVVLNENTSWYRINSVRTFNSLRMIMILQPQLAIYNLNSMVLDKNIEIGYGYPHRVITKVC